MPFARALGLRRRALRTEICQWQDDEPISWQSRHILRWTAQHTQVVFMLDESRLATLIAALRHTRDGGHIRRYTAEAAKLLHRIAAQLPDDMFQHLQRLGQFELASQISTADGRPSSPNGALLSAAMVAESKVLICYTASDGSRSGRVILPLTFTHHGAGVLAWCEAQADFRTFRLDHIAAAKLLAAPWPQSREACMTAWRDAGGRMPQHDISCLLRRFGLLMPFRIIRRQACKIPSLSLPIL